MAVSDSSDTADSLFQFNLPVVEHSPHFSHCGHQCGCGTVPVHTGQAKYLRTTHPHAMSVRYRVHIGIRCAHGSAEPFHHYTRCLLYRPAWPVSIFVHSWRKSAVFRWLRSCTVPAFIQDHETAVSQTGRPAGSRNLYHRPGQYFCCSAAQGILAKPLQRGRRRRLYPAGTALAARTRLSGHICAGAGYRLPLAHTEPAPANGIAGRH